MTEPRTERNATPRPADRAAEPAQYPEKSVVGIIDDPAQLMDAYQALTSGGFLAAEIDVVHGEAAGEQLAESTGRTGLAGLAIRIARKIGVRDEELETKDRYTKALEDGKYVVIVSAPTDERRERAAQVLLEHGGTFVNYLGKLTIEPMRR